jgi:hypothetical protein
LAHPLEIGTNLSLLPLLVEADSIVDGPTAHTSVCRYMGGNQSHAAGSVTVEIVPNAFGRWIATGPNQGSENQHMEKHSINDVN